MKKQAKIDPKVAQLESALARALADYANLERRFGVESSAVIKFANSNLLTNLLDIRDHLAMASVQIKDQGLNMVLSSLDNLLVEEGVTEVKAEGPFDPLTMECQEQGGGAKDQIIKVIRHGYRLHERVLRPARVIVGSGLSAQAGAPAPKVSPAKETSGASV